MTKTEELYFDSIKLDEEEQFIEDNLENIIDLKVLKENYMKKENKKSVTLRLDNKDIENLKIKALEQGLQYQSLISSILHKYLNGAFIEKEEAQKIFALKSFS